MTKKYEELMSQFEANSSLFDIDMDQVIHLRNEVTANDSPSDPVVSSGKAELQLRRLIARFGFNRLPMTIGEFHGLLDYCYMLFTVNGEIHSDAEIQAVWRETAIPIYIEYHPDYKDAILLYCAGNLEALKSFHTENGILEKLETFSNFMDLP